MNHLKGLIPYPKSLSQTGTGDESNRFVLSASKQTGPALIVYDSSSDRAEWIAGHLSGRVREATEHAFALPCLEIKDAPFFEWRGLMLDCSRHFLSTGFLKRYIDLLPRLGMNRLHLHLTDDHGWRIEIKSHPELTDTGAYIEQEQSRRGFYTQKELSEIVGYANERNVMVIPEIEIPGHSYAAVRSLPNLCCTGNPIRNQGHQKDLYCAGKESTFEFLQDVLEEVIDIFPSPYIHIGGDEAPKDRWKECPKCQERMRELGLSNEEELQGYMIGRISKFLRSNDRIPTGWEEVLKGASNEACVVQWWRFRSHGDETRNILGAECCLWTEYLDEDRIDRSLFPRVLAAAELMWNNPRPAERQYDEFLTRVLDAEEYWRTAGVEYGHY